MENPQDEAQKEFEHSVQNTRLESERNELLTQVKAQLLAQMRARNARIGAALAAGAGGRQQD